MMGTPAQQWQSDLALWAIPESILASAPENPWVHPPALFRVADPLAAKNVDTPSFAAARAALVSPGSVLDVGCGGGGSSIGLAASATQLIGVDEQQKMLDNFAIACSEVAVAHQTFCGVWPAIADHVPVADVVVCHHVVYNVGPIEPFIRALSSHARRRVVIELPASHPTSSFNSLWKHFWDLDRPASPNADDFVAVVQSFGWAPIVQRSVRPPRKQQVDTDEFVSFVRRRLCLPAGRDEELRETMQSLGAPSGTETEIVTVYWDLD
jgi:SAM-dependent methyltransferase